MQDARRFERLRHGAHLADLRLAQRSGHVARHYRGWRERPGVVVWATSAIAAPQPVAAATSAGNQLVVTISKGQVQRAANGTVLVPLRARCQPPLGAFELNVSVLQDAVFGSVFLLGTNFPPCDGRWHRLTVAVAPDAGSFVAGRATVDASLSAFHPTEGDLIVFDTATVRL